MEGASAWDGVALSPDWFVAGGVSRFPTLAGACDAGWLDCEGYLDVAARLNGGGGSSKLGRVGAPARRAFNGWAASASSAVLMPGAARVARLADGSRTAKRSGASPSDGGCDRWLVEAAYEWPNVQSRPPDKPPEGLDGSRRGGRRSLGFAIGGNTRKPSLAGKMVVESVADEPVQEAAVKQPLRVVVVMVVKPRTETSPTTGIRVRCHGHRMRETCMISNGKSRA